GAPLSFPSCSPPARGSSSLTVGTPDANGAPAKMIGSLRIDALAGNPAPVANEAEAKVTFNVTDVRCNAGDTRSVCPYDNAQAGRDYTGQLRIRLPLRLTDPYNL